jgi:hypothetical protein
LTPVGAVLQPPSAHPPAEPFKNAHADGACQVLSIAYVFERAAPFPNPDGTTTVKRIDLYKRDCFVLEAKQGSDKAANPDTFALSAPKTKMRRGTAVRGTAGWDAAMHETRGQAELYVRNLPASEHNPPFIEVKETEYRLNALI